MLFLYAFVGCVSVYCVTNQYMDYAIFTAISTISVNEDNVLITVIAVGAGFRLI